MQKDEIRIGDFLSAHGGPFYELQLRLRLLHMHSLLSSRRATIFVVLAWGVPFLLTLAAGRATGSLADRPFLLEPGVWARFAIAISAFIIAEGGVEAQLRKTLEHFTKAPLLAPGSFKEAATAVTEALRRRDSRTAEGICLILGFVLSFLSLTKFSNAAVSSWSFSITPQGNHLTAAGWWCLLFSDPLFFFLLLRGLWRHLVWSILLRRIAAMDLRLVTTHPDGKAGLAFVGRYPNAFSLSVFGLSCVVGAALAHQFLHETISLTTYSYVMGAWLIIVLAVFAYPLLAFSKPLIELKQKTLLLTGAEGTRFQREAERKLLGHNVQAEDPSEAEGEQDANDPAKQYAATQKMSTYLIQREALLPVCAAALLPLFAAGATQLPYKELLSVCKKLLLL